MKNLRNDKVLKMITALTMSSMLVACGFGETPTDVIDDPEPISYTSDETVDELPDDMLETQSTCGKLDESITITEDEINEFMNTYMYALRSNLCWDYVNTSIEDIAKDTTSLENIGAVYGIAYAISELGEGEWYYSYDGSPDSTSADMVENDIIAPDEMDIITSNSIYASGVFCVNAYAVQKVFDEFYGEGVVDVFSFDNYESAFTSKSGYVITGVGIGDGGEYIYEISDIDINCNVATLKCLQYSAYMSTEYDLDGECEIVLYKDAQGVHFYSKKMLMSE